jgi:hypothetical protein
LERHQQIKPMIMSTINERNWQMFNDLRKELGLDKPLEPDVEVKVPKGRPVGSILFRISKPRPDRRKANPQRPGEMPLKAWVQIKAQELGLSIANVWLRIYDGRLPIPNKRIVNKRVIFVKP